MHTSYEFGCRLIECRRMPPCVDPSAPSERLHSLQPWSPRSLKKAYFVEKASYRGDLYSGLVGSQLAHPLH